jgi:hypothetical protein
MKKDQKKLKLMKNASTLLLRLALIALGLVVSIVGVMLSLVAYKNWGREFPDLAYAKYPVMIGLYTIVATFWAALYQAFRLLDLIDRNKSFSKLSVMTLQKIKYCILAIAGVFLLGMPVIFHIAQKDDAPGLILIFGSIFIGVPVVVAVFAGVCQSLFQNAIDIKSENDLTV